MSPKRVECGHSPWAPGLLARHLIIPSLPSAARQMGCWLPKRVPRRPLHRMKNGLKNNPELRMLFPRFSKDIQKAHYPHLHFSIYLKCVCVCARVCIRVWVYDCACVDPVLPHCTFRFVLKVFRTQTRQNMRQIQNQIYLPAICSWRELWPRMRQSWTLAEPLFLLLKGAMKTPYLS